jgi:hypothetical protein
MCFLDDAFNKIASAHALKNEVASIGLVKYIMQSNNVAASLDLP